MFRLFCFRRNYRKWRISKWDVRRSCSVRSVRRSWSKMPPSTTVLRRTSGSNPHPTTSILPAAVRSNHTPDQSVQKAANNLRATVLRPLHTAGGRVRHTHVRSSRSCSAICAVSFTRSTVWRVPCITSCPARESSRPNSSKKDIYFSPLQKYSIPCRSSQRDTPPSSSHQNSSSSA